MSSYFEERIAAIRSTPELLMRRPAPAVPKPRSRMVVTYTAPRKPKRKAKQGFVYFLRSGNVVKIGFTTNPRERAKSLQTGNAEKAFICKLVKGTPHTERQLHDRFAEYRLSGEWFDLRGTLARHLEMHIKPIDLPEAVKQPEEEWDIRL